MESKISDTNNDSEVQLSADLNLNGEKSEKVQSNSLEDSSVSENIESYSITSDSHSTLKAASHQVEFNDHLTCKTVQSEPMELSAEDEIKTTDKCDKSNDVLKGILYTTGFNSIDLSEAQDNSPSSCTIENCSNSLHRGRNKVKRTISKDQVHTSNDILEKSDNSSDEDSSKRQKLNKGACNANAGSLTDDTVTFQKSKSKVKQRNYHKRQNATSDNEDSSGNTSSNETSREALVVPDENEENVATASASNESAQNESSRSSEVCRPGSETPNDESDRHKNNRGSWNEWGGGRENLWIDSDENEDEDAEKEEDEAQDNSPFTCTIENCSNSLHRGRNKVKRTILKDQVHTSNDILEKSDNSSDEDSSKRQKLNKSACNANAESLTDDAVTFQKSKSKVKQRNYRKRQNATSDNEDSSGNISSNETTREALVVPDENEENVATASARNESAQNESSRSSGVCRPGSETPNDESDRHKNNRGGSNEWGGGRENLWDSDENEAEEEDEDEEEDEEEEEDEDKDETPYCLKVKKPPPNWHIVPEMINRQIGNNPLFQRRFYGSLHAVERLELMYNLDEHQGCVNALNFNQKGNLLASASDDLTVVIWDWAVGKKHHWFTSGHTSNMFQAKWLPLDMECLMVTCARDGQVRLLDLKHDTSKKLAAHRGPSHKLAVHPETPHVVFSAGEDARVFSIDIRESKPNKLLVVKEDSSEVQLYSIHSNPLNCNEFCVGGRSLYVRVYDRRKVSKPLYHLLPYHLTGNKHVTCAVYNHNGTEILASYNDEDIYLFNTLMPPRVDTSIDYVHRYQGHRNNATVKGVNFFGPKSEYIISGSDCGNIFIWDKNTEAVVQWMAGDKQGVVNCLEGHPHIPVLATSGLDYDVKIWVPSCKESPIMKSFANCVKSNARNRKQENMRNSFDGQLFWVFLRHIRDRQRTDNLNTHYGFEVQDEDDDDDEDVDDDDDDENGDDDDDDDDDDYH